MTRVPMTRLGRLISMSNTCLSHGVDQRDSPRRPGDGQHHARETSARANIDQLDGSIFSPWSEDACHNRHQCKSVLDVALQNLGSRVRPLSMDSQRWALSAATYLRNSAQRTASPSESAPTRGWLEKQTRGSCLSSIAVASQRSCQPVHACTTQWFDQCCHASGARRGLSVQFSVPAFAASRQGCSTVAGQDQCCPQHVTLHLVACELCGRRQPFSAVHTQCPRAAERHSRVEATCGGG